MSEKSPSELIHSRSYRKGYLDGRNLTLEEVLKIINAMLKNSLYTKWVDSKRLKEEIKKLKEVKA